MKFRLRCAGCGATFFSLDRKARQCPKCVKLGASKKGPVETKPDGVKSPAGRFGPNPDRASSNKPKPRAKPDPRPPKSAELTPELREQITRIYQERFAGGETPEREINAQISDLLWLQRKAVGSVIHRLIRPAVPVTPELKERVIEMYKGYVERSERPPAGRRRGISEAVGVPLHQVRDIIYDWSRSQYAQSPTPQLSREQMFEIEKVYWEEIGRKRYRYSELPARIAERLSFATSYQVSRWLDMLHDDQSKFDKFPDPSPEIEQRIIEAYMKYLDAPRPPERGLHGVIASQIEGVNGRQVHKVLQRYRYLRRDEYPLK